MLFFAAERVAFGCKSSGFSLYLKNPRYVGHEWLEPWVDKSGRGLVKKFHFIPLLNSSITAFVLQGGLSSAVAFRDISSVAFAYYAVFGGFLLVT